MSKGRVRRGRKLRAWLAASAVALVALSASATAQAVPANFWGVVPQAYLNFEQFQRLHRGGADSVRIPVTWSAVQHVRNGGYDWSTVDPQFEAATLAGLEVLPFLSGAPTWAVPSVFVPGSGRSVKAVAHLPVSGPARSGWIDFVTEAVARYGPDGVFWAQHPNLVPRPVRTWQVWNEENFKYFVTKPNPAEYGKLVKLSHTALRAADPGAKVVLGGMFARPKGGKSKAKPKRVYWASDFLDLMYETTPGIKAKFDGVALHPYTGDYRELTGSIEEFRQVLSENKDTGKGLWITELGWSSQPTAPTTNVFAKGLAGQARQLRGAFSLLERKQVKWRLKRVFWFSVDDMGGVCNFCDGSGLFGSGFKPKKSWFEYVKFAGGTP